MARYQFLFEVSRRMKAQAVMVGHNADDQVETMLMHFVRGSGLNGLKAMPLAGILPEWDEEIPLVRPLLYTWREEIMAYCAEHQLEPRMDASNLENTFFRNRLRNELIPLLQTYNPNIKEVLLRSNISLADDQAWLQEELELAWNRLAPEVGGEYVRFQRAAFLSFHPGAKRNLLRKMTAQLIPHARDISFETIQACLSFIKTPTTTNQKALEQNLVIRLAGDAVYLTKDVQAALCQQEGALQVEGEETGLTVPGEAALAFGRRILAEVLPVEAAGAHPAFHAAGHAFMDAGKAAGSLGIRNSRAGDRFSPLGMGGQSLTLADFWTNEKLPRELRKNWPLVCQGKTIIWVPGYRISDAVKVTSSTVQVMHLWIEH
jgi:tRNA(Ile)-lysidine synthase